MTSKKSPTHFLWLLVLLPFVTFGQGQYLFDTAEASFHSNEYDQALPVFQKAYAAFEKAKDSLGMTECLIRQGYIHLSKFQKEQSLSFYQQAAGIAKSIDNKPSYLIAIDAISTMHLLAGDTRKAIPLLEEGLDLGIQLDSVARYSSKMISLGRAYLQLGKLDSAQVLMQEALQIKRKINHLPGEANALEMLGQISHNLGDYEKSLNYQRAAYHIYETKKDSIRLISCYKNFSNIFLAIGDQDNAERYAIKGYDLADRFKLKTFKANILSNMAIINTNKGLFDKAQQQYQVIIDIYQQTGNNTKLIGNQLNMANIYIRKGETGKAEPIIIAANKLADELDDKINKVQALTSYGKLHIKQNQTHDALPFLLEAASISEEHNLQVKLKDASFLIAQTYHQLGQHLNAFKWQETYSTLVDTIFQQDKQQTIYNYETRYQVDQKEKQIILLNTQNELSALQLQTANRRQLFLGIGLLGLAGIVGLGFFFYRTKQRDNQLLEEKNKIISEALSEKELLLKEIHHRVKNNLQVISSLLSMQSYQIKDEQALEAVREGKDRVKSMALIHQSLYQDVNLIAVDSQTYIEKLTQSLFHSYNIDPQRISLQSHIDPLKLDVDIMIPLGLILNELISNALKYAFQDGRNGQINVQLSQEEDLIQLNVSDNGIGLPEDFNIEQTESMGYLIVKDFCKKLNAFFQVSNKGGAQINLSIPYEKN